MASGTSATSFLGAGCASPVRGRSLTTKVLWPLLREIAKFVSPEPLLKLERLWTRPELLCRPSPLSSESWLYARYIEGLPTPFASCHSSDDYPPVYIGIAPSRPASKATLCSRIKQHLRGNAAGDALGRLGFDDSADRMPPAVPRTQSATMIGSGLSAFGQRSGPTHKGSRGAFRPKPHTSAIMPIRPS